MYQRLLYIWRKKINSKKSDRLYKTKESKRWSSEDKFHVVMETYSFNEADLAAYCRKKGLYVEQVKDWSKQCLQANANTNSIDPTKIENELKEEKNIEAYELDFYNISNINRKFDCIWSMNSLLHVPKTDLPQVLNEINLVLNEEGLFYMGVYGGADTENSFVNEVTDTPRFFS